VDAIPHRAVAAADLRCLYANVTIDSMRKPLRVLETILMAGAVLFPSAAAQQPTTTAPPAKKSPAPAAQKTPSTATKSGAATSKSETVTTLNTPKQKASYAIGMNWGAILHRQNVDVDSAALFQGMKDAMAGGKTLMTEEEARAALTQLQTEMQAKQQERIKQESETNKKEGEAFLAANKSREGVVALPSGLQYKVITMGTGPKPTTSDSVVCNYRGTLINGEEFDSSFKRGEPATFPVTGVIKGWTEALQLMPTGSKWQLFIPSELAYGPRGNGPIGPNSTLIFEIELLSIKQKEAAPGAAPEKAPAAAPTPKANPAPAAAPTPK